MKTASEYTAEVKQAIMSNYANNMQMGMYFGPEGCRRFAREYGCGLADYPAKQAEAEITGSYSMCVIVYGLMPPLDAGEWNALVREAMEGRR